MPITVSSLIYYPIKACRGFEIETAQIERMGLAHDRRMMLITEGGKFLTQRQHPKLALVTPKLENGTLALSAPDFDSLQVAIRTDGPTQPVDVWHSTNVPAVDQGDEAAEWFSNWLDAPVRLVHIAAGAIRKVNPQYAVRAGDHTGFADGYPILLISEESLHDLNTRLASPVPMNRFRPNLVVRGCDPYAEDTWNQIRVGDVELSIVKPCPRCEVTTIDKDTLKRDKEPLKTLGKYRKHPLGAIFGQNVIPLTEGPLRLGMEVEPLFRQTER